MKKNPVFGLISDPHWSSQDVYIPSNLDCDALLCLGDLSGDEQNVEIFSALIEASHHVPVFFVPGNHDFEGRSIHGALTHLRSVFDPYPNIKVLYNETAHFMGVDLIGSTLWSNFSLYGDQQKEKYQARIQSMLHDFKSILNDHQTDYISPQDLEKEFEKAVQFIESEIQKNESLSAKQQHMQIVLTHFAPSAKSIAPYYENSPLNPYYASSVDHLVERVNLWCHGHVHSHFNYKLGDVEGKGHVLTNPRGFLYRIPRARISHKDIEKFKTLDPLWEFGDDFIQKENPYFKWPYRFECDIEKKSIIHLSSLSEEQALAQEKSVFAPAVFKR